MGITKAPEITTITTMTISMAMDITMMSIMVMVMVSITKADTTANRRNPLGG